MTILPRHFGLARSLRDLGASWGEITLGLKTSPKWFVCSERAFPSNWITCGGVPAARSGFQSTFSVIPAATALARVASAKTMRSFEGGAPVLTSVIALERLTGYEADGV